MPEIHVVNGQPRECSDAIRARGLIDEWLSNPDATEVKVAELLAAEAAERATHPPVPKHQQNQTVLPPTTSTGPIPPRRPRSAEPAPPKVEE